MNDKFKNYNKINYKIMKLYLKINNINLHN